MGKERWCQMTPILRWIRANIKKTKKKNEIKWIRRVLGSLLTSYQCPRLRQRLGGMHNTLSLTMWRLFVGRLIAKRSFYIAAEHECERGDSWLSRAVLVSSLPLLPSSLVPQLSSPFSSWPSYTHSSPFPSSSITLCSLSKPVSFPLHPCGILTKSPPQATPTLPHTKVHPRVVMRYF